jgi:hypothetical protein
MEPAAFARGPAPRRSWLLHRPDLQDLQRGKPGSVNRQGAFVEGAGAVEVALAVQDVLLFQIRFFTTGKDAPEESEVDPRIRVLLLVVLTATVFGSLEAIREGRGRWSAVLVTVGLAVSLLPILLRVLPALQRDARTQQRHPHYWVTVLGLGLYAVIVLLVVAHP